MELLLCACLRGHDVLWGKTDSQIALILRQTEEEISSEVSAAGPASPRLQTYYRGRNKYGGLMTSEMKCLKQLQKEIQPLQRL